MRCAACLAHYSARLCAWKIADLQAHNASWMRGQCELVDQRHLLYRSIDMQIGLFVLSRCGGCETQDHCNNVPHCVVARHWTVTPTFVPEFIGNHHQQWRIVDDTMCIPPPIGQGCILLVVSMEARRHANVNAGQREPATGFRISSNQTVCSVNPPWITWWKDSWAPGAPTAVWLSKLTDTTF